MKSGWCKIKIFCVYLSIFLLGSCAAPSYWPEVQGRVLDETSNQPIENVIVVAKWGGYRNHAFIKSRSECYHVETTTTDNNGHFAFGNRIDGVSMLHDRTVDYVIYKSGYVTSDKTYEKVNYKNNIKFLKTFVGSRKERLDYLFRLNTLCHGTGENKKNLILIQKNIVDEIKDYVKTNEEIKKLRIMRWSIERLEYGIEEADRRFYQGKGD